MSEITTALDARAAAILAELVDRSRALGSDRSLVIFGGGNTSVKATITDHLGRDTRVMWVKGSGSDLISATPGDFPALRLDDLLPLRDITRHIDDDEMIDLVSRALVDPSSKRPSIETLLHAFLPYTHVDHVHADVICALTNHDEGERTTREALGEGFAYVDWKRSGFELSRMVGTLGDYEGVVLAQHGLITWGDTSASCLARTREVVAQVADYVAANRMPAADASTTCPELPVDERRRLLVKLRGLLSAESPRVLVVDEDLRRIADRPDVHEIVAASVSTADHMMRIKPWSAVLPPSPDDDQLTEAIDGYAEHYRAYAERHRDRLPAGYGPHSALPTIVLAPGVGGIAAAPTRKEATALAELAGHTHGVAAMTKDSFGTPRAMSEVDTFDVDYWPMELYKLSLRPAPKRLSGRVYVVTGAASGIGRGIALRLAAEGANLVLADLDGDKLETVAGEARAAGSVEPLLAVGDQSQSAVVDGMLGDVVGHFGGLDGIVANAGIGMAGQLHELTDEQWRAALDVNLTSAFQLTRAAVNLLRRQGIGGALVYVASKNVFAPGAGFGAYSASKAGMTQLMRVAALEGGKHGIRANAVNPDAVFDNSLLWAGGIREERAAAHGVKPEELEDFYAARNLLNRRVTTADVAATVAFLLSDESSRTTGAVVPVDGGVAAAFPR